MTERVRGNYAHTIYASYIGYITQAIVNNFAPLLFLTFASEFGLRLEQITILTTLNLKSEAVAFVDDNAFERDEVGFAHPKVRTYDAKEAAGLTGIALTKLDGTAKGGIVIAIAKELGVPVKLAGVGEGLDDLKPFDAKDYVEAII